MGFLMHKIWPILKRFSRELSWEKNFLFLKSDCTIHIYTTAVQINICNHINNECIFKFFFNKLGNFKQFSALIFWLDRYLVNLQSFFSEVEWFSKCEISYVFKSKFHYDRERERSLTWIISTSCSTPFEN